MISDDALPGPHGANSRLQYVVNRLARALNRSTENIALAHGVSLPEFMIIMVLGEGDALSNAQLGRRTFVTAQAAHTVISGLVERGLIRRDAHPTNRRIKLASLTPEGWDVLNKCLAEIVDVEERILESLHPVERTVLLPGLLDCAQKFAGGYFGDKEAEKTAIARRIRQP